MGVATAMKQIVMMEPNLDPGFDLPEDLHLQGTKDQTPELRTEPGSWA